MNRGFYTIMAAQFFSSLADNALLIAAIALLARMQAPGWMTPVLKLFFSFYLMCCSRPSSAHFSDALPKGRVMFITNMIKVVGCALLFFNVHPLLAYAVVGFWRRRVFAGQIRHPDRIAAGGKKLVAANGWIEGLTVSSIILGTVMGGALVDEHTAALLLQFDLPLIDTGVNTPHKAALSVIVVTYLLAALFNLHIPDTGAHYAHQQRNPIKLIADFAHCYSMLWKDKLGQISLAVTTLFWGAGATLQFIVLEWAKHSLNMPLHKAANLQGIVALGVALGAVAAARLVPLKKSPCQ
ncbi:lysophospholipid transporter LplT [Undibacterium arcticum]